MNRNFFQTQQYCCFLYQRHNYETRFLNVYEQWQCRGRVSVGVDVVRISVGSRVVRCLHYQLLRQAQAPLSLNTEHNKCLWTIESTALISDNTTLGVGDMDNEEIQIGNDQMRVTL